VVELIKDQSIALRLKAGSDEAGYLAQIFPLPRTPTVVIIKNGELKEYITPETSKEDFLRRIQNSFSAPTSSSQPAPASAPQPEPASTTPSSEPASSSRETSTSENVRRILAERAKLKAEKEEAERKAQKERKAQEERTKAKGKGRAEVEDAESNNDIAHKAAEAVKKRRQQEQEERRRILARIEADKAERKLQAAAREQQRLEDQQTGDSAATSLVAPERKIVPSSTKKASGMTAVQVRLFDGSTLRSRFKSEAPLKDVRTWVDENRNDGTQPYTFKQVLTPMPNKTIDATEESKSVGDLGLSPSSTLVLIPVQKYSSAYDGASQGIVSKIIGFFLGILYRFLGLFTSGEGQGTNNTPASTSENQESSQDRSRIQRFQNQNDRLRDQQLYNGNSVSPTHKNFTHIYTKAMDH
jgi:hypothetical protein